MSVIVTTPFNSVFMADLQIVTTNPEILDVNTPQQLTFWVKVSPSLLP